MKAHFLLFIFVWFFATNYTEARIKGDTIKILAIGNSFSDDGTEYLDDLAQAAGIPIVVGNLVIGGCSLQRHWENIAGNRPQYEYRKSKNCHSANTSKVSLHSALTDEEWDYITVQQVSHYAGMEETYFPYLTYILAYVKNYATNPDVRFAFQQTWAYPQNSTHGGFKNYGNKQSAMYAAIMKTSKEVTSKVNINIVIPSGTAIQNLRSVVGDTVCRDGFHLSFGLGRYTAACAWFETLCKHPVAGNAFIPKGITPQEASIAQKAAHNAVKNPYTTSALDKLKAKTGKRYSKQIEQ